MGGMIANALSNMGRCEFGVAALIALGVVVASWMLSEPGRDFDAERVAARNLWLSDCSEPLAVCAQQWDDGYTLRRIYQERVGPIFSNRKEAP